MTVLETPGFLRDAAAAMTDQERIEAIYFLAANPDAGDVIPDTGGGRKLRSREARRRANHLLLPQRIAAPVPSQRIREERKGQFDEGRTERNEEPVTRLVAGYRKRTVP